MKPATLEPGRLSAHDRILLTAHDLFYRHGVRATGIDLVIAESGVAKLTFYRHFPSKNALVLAVLDHRHRRWMAWFTDALARHRSRNRPALEALVPALAEWFHDKNFRGCAFLNTVIELGGTLPGVMAACRLHKQDMTAAIAELLPASRQRKRQALAIAIAVDGAIVHAQFERDAKASLKALDGLLHPYFG
ncbi:MAG: TetR/AcrR family transcriptional regulator [Xanthomonadaceae bacterium]|nr:TetR/AcrR family transcriptional regulator [Xanthomonadaceae bacterium]